MIVVSDTSPLTNLWQIKAIDILPKLFSEVLIPLELFEELQRNPPQRNVFQNFTWLHIVSVNDPEAITEILSPEVHRGEAAAIALAIEQQADLLLMDDRRGRLIAQQKGFIVTGLLGILLKAKEKKIIPSVKLLMDSLRQDAGFYIADTLYEQVLLLSKETP